MFSFIVCVWLLAVFTAESWGQQVYLSLGSTIITTNNTEVFITAIREDGASGLPSLTCHSDSSMCCRKSDSEVDGGVGGWYYPDGTEVQSNTAAIAAGQGFYRVRNAPMVIRLARRSSVSPPFLSPTGSYCCVIPTTGGEMTFCANLVVCPSLSLTNGMVSYSDPTLGVGSEATYSCDTGYTLNGVMTRTCESGETWSGSDPTCGATTPSGTTPPPVTTATTDPPVTTCSDLPAPSNTMIFYSSDEFPDSRPVDTVAAYSCDTGYTLNGGSTRTCQSGGTWSGSAPTCTATTTPTTPKVTTATTPKATTATTPKATTATTPVQINNMLVYLSLGSTTITTNNTEVLITGLGEDVPGGSPSLTCHTDLTSCCRTSDNNMMGPLGGEWYYPDGRMVPNSAAGEGFYRIRNAPQVARLARRIVAPGVTLTMGPTGTYCCVIPTTGGEMTFCANLVVCPSLSLTNGMVSYSDPPQGVGSEATFSCDVGTKRTCQSDGTWSGSTPACAMITTMPPPTSSTSSSTTSGPGSSDPNTGDGGTIAAVIIVVLLLIAVVVVGVVIGIYLWKKLRQNQTKYTSRLPQRPPPPRPTPYNSIKKSNGEGKGTMEMKVKGPSIVEFPSETRAVEGEEVYLKVKVGGHPPPTLTWYHDGKEVTPDYATELDDDGGVTFPSVEAKHAGLYRLVVTGPGGSTEEREVRLTIESEWAEAGGPGEGVDYAPIPVAQFGDYVAGLHANNNKKIKDLYKNLDSGERGHPVSISITPENRPNNRFGNIAVYDDNRIVLQPIKGQEDCQSDYINACYVDGYGSPNKFIATQGPLPRTLVDFWRLVWQERPPIIVMLTNLKEGKKIKCQPYWPESGKKKFGPFTVTITDQQVLADYTIRSLQAKLDGDRRVLSLKLFHFTAWPDHGVPDYASPVLGFHRRVKSQHNPSKGPLLVHCSAGVGRTGTYIVIDNVLEQIAAEGVVDISGAIVKARNQRMKLVQTQDQYIFIHDAILESVTCGDTQINAGNLRRQIQRLSQVAKDKNCTGFQYQFQILEQVTPNPSQVRSTVAVKNANLNRTMKYLPPELSRVILKGEQPDYIHAVFAHGYKHQKAYIIAQNPLPSTVRNFWKVIYDRKCAAVVMLTPLRENGEEVCSQYWPETGGVTTFGEYTIDNLGEECNPGFTMRQMSIFSNEIQKAHQVTQFQILNWNRDGVCENLKTVTDIIEEVGKVQRRTGNNPIMVHCDDTATRSGMFCATATTIDRCKTEGVVDVFQVVKALRVHKPGAVPSVENYKDIFEALVVFLESFDDYANFQVL